MLLIKRINELLPSHLSLKQFDYLKVVLQEAVRSLYLTKNIDFGWETKQFTASCRAASLGLIEPLRGIGTLVHFGETRLALAKKNLFKLFPSRNIYQLPSSGLKNFAGKPSFRKNYMCGQNKLLQLVI